MDTRGESVSGAIQDALWACSATRSASGCCWLGMVPVHGPWHGVSQSWWAELEKSDSQGKAKMGMRPQFTVPSFTRSNLSEVPLGRSWGWAAGLQQPPYGTAAGLMPFPGLLLFPISQRLQQSWSELAADGLLMVYVMVFVCLFVFWNTT